MVAQVVLALELLATHLAAVDGVERVVGHVHAQLVVEAKLLAALGAVVLIGGMLRAVVLRQLQLVLGFEVTLGTLDASTVRVLHVPNVHLLCLERFVANLTK